MNWKYFFKEKHIYWILFGLISFVYVIGLFIPLYGVDVSIYSSISREILETGNWLEITTKGKDYLDKPPFLFWTSALSYLVFGFNSFAYKFPSFIFTIIGIYSTYLLGKELYNKRTGVLAALILYSCEAWFLFNMDVRTDTIVCASIILSVSQIILYLKTNNWLNFVLAFIGISIAMLTKGPIGLMVPLLGLGTHFLIKREWKSIFKWQWIIGLFIVGILISPMLYGLYTQFDSHPEKVTILSSGIESEKGISGIKFYFWDQSFGRITGGNKEWKDDSSSFFFVHTFLWAFFPWAFLAILAIFKRGANLLKDKVEYITIGAIILPFIAFSMSQFKLPHYINVIFPFVSILTADYILKYKSGKISLYFHYFLSLIIVTSCFITLIYVFPTSDFFIWAGFILILILGFIIIQLKSITQLRLPLYLACSSLLLNFVLNAHFLNEMTNYNASYQISKIINEINPDEIHTNMVSGYTLDIFSFPVNSNSAPFISINENKKTVFFCNSAYKKTYEKKYPELIKNIYKVPYYRITSLSFDFINPKTRASKVQEYYLIEFN